MSRELRARGSSIGELLRQLRDDFTLLDQRAVFALVYAAFALACINYLRYPAYLAALLSNTRFAAIGVEAATPTANNLYLLLWLVAVSLTFYFVIPALVVRFVQRRPLTEVGLALSIEKGFLKLLLICLAILLPLVYLMSLTESFSSKYPFLRIHNGEPYLGATLLIWEIAYLLQFFGLEFFFRGFLVHSLKPSLGAYSVLIMTVPYCMIHFTKPLPETFAAIVAGIFLGWLSYRNGNIWLGLLLHCTVAVTMDLLALQARGLLY